jgi:hypothetical protein
MAEKTVAMPSFKRAADITSYNEAENTIDVVWAAGAKVRRYSWRDGAYYDESLVMKPEAVRLDRLNAGAPLLDSHNSWSLSSVIGSVVPGTAKIERGKGYATVKLSRAPEDAATVGKIRDGIIRNISVGYISHRIEKTEPGEEGGVADWRVIDWEPMEISAVPIPADPDAQVRSAPDDKEQKFPCVFIENETRNAASAADHQENTNMSKDNAAEAQRGNETQTAPVATKPDPAAEAAVRAANDQAAKDAANLAVRNERDRIASIRTIAGQFNARDFGDQHAALDTDIPKFRELLLEHLAKQTEAQRTTSTTGVNVHVGEVNPEKRGAAIENALLHRSAPLLFKLTDDARDFRGLSLLEIGRECLAARGISTRGMSKLEVARMALESTQERSGGLHSTSDFPIILANVASKTLRAAYEAAPQTFRPLVRETTVPDFKPVTRAQLGEAPQFDKVNEHGEFERGSIGEAGESYKIATYGKIVGITRQVLVNDDLDAFTRLPRAFGGQAAQLESDLVWAQILGNPLMGDGTALFHADHGNLGAALAIGVAGVSAGRLAMAKQTGLDKKTVLNISPAYIIVPKAKETDLEQFLGQIVPTKSSDVVPNSMKKLIPISDPRLDNGIPRAGVTGSATNWYLAGDAAQTEIIELAYLEGQQGVYTETRMGFDVDGVEVKVRLDVGAKVIEWRGLWKNPI